MGKIGRDRSGIGARRERGIARVVTTAVVVAIAASTLIFVMPHARAATEVHLTAAGDYGARASTATVLQKIADLDPDAHLALGDLRYGDVASENAWCSYVKARVGEGFPFELISGNHESLDEAEGLINNYSACLPNQIPGVVGTYGREYYMDFPQGAPLVRVIEASPTLTFEDGVWAYAQGDAHYNWVSNAIDDGRAKGAKWIIVTSHIPCLSVGIYNCPGATDFYRLLAAKKVDLVLHGHEHGYMRTHQLRSGVSGCTTIPSGTFNPACVADSDNAYIAGQGSVFATVGTGGTPAQRRQRRRYRGRIFRRVRRAEFQPDLWLARPVDHRHAVERTVRSHVGRDLLRFVHDHQGRATGEPAAGRGVHHAGPGPHGDRRRFHLHGRGRHRRLLRLGLR